MKLENITEGDINSPPELTIFEELNYNFNKGNKVIPNKIGLERDSSLLDLDFGIIKEIKKSDLGDMSVWTIYLEEKPNVRNPYLASYFKPYETTE